MSTGEALESELAKLEARRSTLQAKLSAATEALEAARAEQREHLIADVDDAKARVKIDNKLSEHKSCFACRLFGN